MQENVKRIVLNSSDVNRMELASIDIKESAFSVQSRARALETEAKKRQCRLIAVLVIVGVSILLYIIIPLATTSN